MDKTGGILLDAREPELHCGSGFFGATRRRDSPCRGESWQNRTPQIAPTLPRRKKLPRRAQIQHRQALGGPHRGRGSAVQTHLTAASFRRPIFPTRGDRPQPVIVPKPTPSMKKLIFQPFGSFVSLALARLIRRFSSPSCSTLRAGSQPAPPAELPVGSLSRPTTGSRFALRANLRFLLLTSSFLLLSSSFTSATIVEAEGRAPGDMNTSSNPPFFSK